MYFVVSLQKPKRKEKTKHALWGTAFARKITKALVSRAIYKGKALAVHQKTGGYMSINVSYIKIKFVSYKLFMIPHFNPIFSSINNHSPDHYG